MNLQTLIQQIDELKRELDALRPISVEREAKIKQTFRLWWNYHSNAIEGNQLTLGETISLILYDLTAKGKSYKDHREVKGHNEALLWIEEIVDESRPITQTFIRELHQMLLKEPYDSPAITPTGQTVQKKIKVGEYKTTPNHVRTQTGEIYHYALPEEVPAKMDDLLRWYEQEKTDLHPLILAATFHYRFVKIHPFDDGNGRMSRVLMNLILMQNNYPPAIIKMENRAEYLAALSEADAGDIEKFIFFVGESLLESTELYVRGAKGENIAEADDLDKKIALLKLQLKNQPKDHIAVRNSFETQIEVFNKSLMPLFLHLRKKLSQFDELFFEKDNYALIHDKRIPLEELEEYFLKKLSRNQSNIPFLIKKMHFIYSFKDFKYNGINPFNIVKSFEIKFSKYEYTYKLDSWKNSHKRKSYNVEIKQSEVKDISSKMIQEILTEIQEKTNTEI